MPYNVKYGRVNIWNLCSSKRLLTYVFIVKECVLHIVYKQVSINNNKTTHFSWRWASSSWWLGIIMCLVVKCSSNNLIPNINQHMELLWKNNEFMINMFYLQSMLLVVILLWYYMMFLLLMGFSYFLPLQMHIFHMILEV